MDCFLVKNGGGAPLNFKVVGNPQPATPKENIIWVNTDVPIPEWRFAAENPYVVESDNLYVAATSPGYIDSNGSIQSNSDWKVTDFIELPNGTQNVTIRMSSNSSESPCHAFYDASKNLLSTVYRKPNASTYAVPANAKYIRLSERLGEGVELVADYMKNVAEGAMWFPAGTSSPVEFNALKKNGIQVYPQGAKQYVSGALVSKNAKIYQGGTWVDWWDGELYDAGNQYEYITGGWQSGGSGGTATIGTDSLSVSAPGSNKNASITTKNMIDLSWFNTLSVNVTSWSSSDNSNNRCQIRVLDSTKQVIASANVSSIREYTVNVSSLDKGYIQLYAYASASEGYTHRMTVNKIGLK